MSKQPLRRIEYLSIDAIQPAKRNPKGHDIESIKASYRRFAAQDSPVLDERTGRLLSGHGRIEALQGLRDAGEDAPEGIDVVNGEWLAPVQRGGSTKNDREAEDYIIAANRLTEKGGWDTSILSEMLDDTENWEGVGFDGLNDPDLLELLGKPIDLGNLGGGSTGPEDNQNDDNIPEVVDRPAYEDGESRNIGKHTIVCSDCIAYLKTLPDNSVDAIVTDPPYGIGMDLGRNDWDASVPGLEWAQECLRVLKPGGHIVAFGATRMVHRLAVAIEDAGFELRDLVAWQYSTGFPKNLDISKAIDRMKHNRSEVLEITAWIRQARDAAGIKNTDIDSAFGFAGMAGHWTTQKSQPTVPTIEQVPLLMETLGVDDPPERIKTLLLDLNATKGAPGPNWWKREVVGHKEGVNTKRQTIAAPTAAQGLSKSTKHIFDVTTAATAEAQQWEGWGTALKPSFEPAVLARKPLIGSVADNVLRYGTGALNIDGCRIPPGDPAWPMGDAEYSDHELGRWPANSYACPKPVSSEKDAGLEHLATSTAASVTGRKEGSKGSKHARAGKTANGKNFHSTVKPIRIMRWILRLVVPPQGIVVDSFIGSGTTMIAAEREGFACIGIEQDGEYCALAEARLGHAIKNTGT